MSLLSDRMVWKIVRCMFCLLPLVSIPAARAQLAPGQVFTDVQITDPDFDATTTLYQLNVTAGCSTTPFKFCPNDDLQRQDMAVLIVRSWSIRLWNDPEAWRTQAPIFTDQYGNTPPYFSDVPVGSAQFVYIQKLYEIGITGGFYAPVVSSSGVVTPGIFCPNSTDNGFNSTYCTAQSPYEGLTLPYHIAVYVSRARQLSDNGCSGQYTTASVPYLHTTTNQNCTATISASSESAYFTDVPSSDTYYKYIQRLGDKGAYTGAYSPTPYQGCPNCYLNEYTVPVTRGIMAIITVQGIGLDPRSTLTFGGPSVPT